MTSTAHIYEVRPRKDRRGFDLIPDMLPFGRGLAILIKSLEKMSRITREGPPNSEGPSDIEAILSICSFEVKVALGRVASELFRAIHTRARSYPFVAP
jgi:hypothetical protein